MRLKRSSRFIGLKVINFIPEIGGSGERFLGTAGKALGGGVDGVGWEG